MPEYNPTKLIIPRLGLGLTLSVASLVINLNIYNMPAEHPFIAWLTMTLGNVVFIGFMYFQITFNESLKDKYSHKIGLDLNDLNTPGKIEETLIHIDSGLCLMMSGLCYTFAEVSTDFPGFWWLLGFLQILAGAWCISATLPERSFREKLAMQAVRD